MSTDPVAVYAAVVATGALGWQVYQWRSDWNRKRDESKGRLEVALVAEWRSDDNKLLYAVVTNRNDYPVRLMTLKVGTEPSDPEALPRLLRGGWYTFMPPTTAGLPAEVPPHDSVSYSWHAAELFNVLAHDDHFRPGYTVTVSVINSLGQEYATRAEVEDHSPFYPPSNSLTFPPAPA